MYCMPCQGGKGSSTPGATTFATAIIVLSIPRLPAHSVRWRVPVTSVMTLARSRTLTTSPAMRSQRGALASSAAAAT